MILVIDVGNSNIEFGVFKENALLSKWRTTTTLSTVDELGLSLTGFLRMHRVLCADIRGCIISSVVPLLTKPMFNMCQLILGITPFLVDVKNVELPISICYENPEEVGADRIVNAVAAYTAYNSACLIIDFGTATTFCVVDHKGRYLGGCITPGIQISLDALFKRAAKLSRVAFEKTQSIIGKNTTSSIQSGVFFGYLSMVEGIIKRIKKEFVSELTVIATGGICADIASESLLIEHIDKDLTLKGLKQIFDLQENNI